MKLIFGISCLVLSYIYIIVWGSDESILVPAVLTGFSVIFIMLNTNLVQRKRRISFREFSFYIVLFIIVSVSSWAVLYLFPSLIKSGVSVAEGQITGWRVEDKYDVENDTSRLADEDRESHMIGITESLEMQIPTRGELKNKTQADVKIKPNNVETREWLIKNKLYVRAKSLNNFDGVSGWSLYNPTLKTLISSGKTVEMANSKNFGSKLEYTVEHTSEKKLVYHMPELLRVSLSNVKILGDSSYYLPKMPVNTNGNYSYRCESNALLFDAIPLHKRSSLKVADTPANLRQNALSPELAYKLSVTAKVLDEKPGVYAKLASLRAMLQHNCTYSVKVENTANLTPIENFLYHEKKGYCLHFATAGVLLCRELGIPARISFGYAGGTYFKAHDQWVLYSDNAHSWLEVKLQDYGWVILETTPSAEISQTVAPKGEIPDDLGLMSSSDSQLKEISKVDFKNLVKEIYERSRVFLTVIFVLLVFLFVITGCQKSFAKKQGATDRKETQKQKNLKEKAYMKVYRKKALSKGVPMLFGDTLRSHLSRLDHLPEFHDDLLKYHYETVYFTREEKVRLEKNLRERIRKW